MLFYTKNFSHTSALQAHCLAPAIKLPYAWHLLINCHISGRSGRSGRPEAYLVNWSQPCADWEREGCRVSLGHFRLACIHTCSTMHTISSSVVVDIGHYYLRQGAYVFGPVCLFVCWLVCLFVCLSVNKISQEFMNGFSWNFVRRLLTGYEGND